MSLRCTIVVGGRNMEGKIVTLVVMWLDGKHESRNTLHFSVNDFSFAYIHLMQVCHVQRHSGL